MTSGPEDKERCRQCLKLHFQNPAYAQGEAVLNSVRWAKFATATPKSLPWVIHANPYSTRVLPPVHQQDPPPIMINSDFVVEEKQVQRNPVGAKSCWEMLPTYVKDGNVSRAGYVISRQRRKPMNCPRLKCPMRWKNGFTRAHCFALSRNAASSEP